MDVPLMDADRNEQRRFILWSISRTVPPPATGPRVVHPVPTEPARPGLLVRIVSVMNAVLKRLFANPLTTLTGAVCAIVFLLSTFFCARQIIAIAKIADAYTELERLGAVRFPNHPSRIVFRDPSLSASDLQKLVPYLKAIPTGGDLNAKLPPCRVLDFTSCRNITEIEVYPLMDELEMTVMLFYTKKGLPQNARSFDLQRLQMNAERRPNVSR